MSKNILVALLVPLICAGLVSIGLAQHVVDVQANVPLYGQESCIWCGAACGQMIMNGYPNPANRVFFPQVDVWDTIQVHNSTDPADAAWATDPVGLRGAMMAMNPPPGGTWNVHQNPDRDKVMFDILFWMNRNNYPVATLINHGGHWVVIVAYETDVEPVSGSTPTLVEITKYDPEPHNVGSVSTMTAALWFASDWVGPVWYAGSWLDDYVAVIEPPVQKGTVKFKPMKRIGEEVLPPKEAAEYAQKWVRQRELAKKRVYAVLARPDVKPLEPLLVREQTKPPTPNEKQVPHYYIVPFGLQREAKEGRQVARVCVIVNAYTGEFEEVGAFGKPFSYLTKDSAVQVAAKALGLKREEFVRVETTLMFQPSDITHIRLHPFWVVKSRERVLYVDQLGQVYRSIKRSIPGD